MSPLLKLWAPCLLSLLFVSLQTQGELNCPSSFLPIHGECISTLEASLSGSYFDALEFCGSMNPAGFGGYLWSPSLSHPDLFDQMRGGGGVGGRGKTKVWSGGHDSDDKSDSRKRCPSKLIEDDSNEPIKSLETTCSSSLPFVCAVKETNATDQVDPNCSDYVDSDFCFMHKDIFCNSASQLAALCSKTCGVCDVMSHCASMTQLWSHDVCSALATEGHCVNETNNIDTFCPVTCCYFNMHQDLKIGNPGLSVALESNCEDSFDLAKCPQVPEVDKCFKEPEFAHACQHTCCVLTKAIREVALAFLEKRASSFAEDIRLHHCRTKYDDVFPFSMCSDIDACSVKKRRYCEATCCARRHGFHVITTSSESPYSSDCDMLDNIYPDLVCQIVTEAADCEHARFRKHCRRSCCETGFEYPDSTTTIDPEDECSAYTDEDAICVGVSDESGCSSAEFSGCFYSCCTLENPIQTSTSSESTSTSDGLCASYVDADPETCEQITGIVGCKTSFQDCERTCCRFMSSYENVTSTTVEVTTVDPDDCKDLENLYPNKFCESVADDSDCEHPSFRKHCQKRCCLLGFEYANGSTTVSPNDECLEFSDERRRCHAISELSDCELPRYELCHYTCCELRRQASRVTSVTTTTAIDDPCEDYSDSDESCETEIESLADCASRMATCERSCCLKLQKLPTTSSPTTVAQSTPIVEPETTSVDVTTTEDANACHGFEDKISKCLKLKNDVLCGEEPFKSGCKATCCKFSNGGESTIVSSIAPTTEIQNCENLDDLFAKCQFKATPENCNEEPFLSKCKHTCCQIRKDVTTTEDPPTTVGNIELTTSTSTGQCSEFDDVWSKCAHKATSLNCLLEPFASNCKYSCCKIEDGVLTDKTTTEDPITDGITIKTTTITSECSELNDKISKCRKRATTQNCDQEPYKTGCEYSCCILGVDIERTTAEKETTTAGIEPTSTVSGDVCSGLVDRAVRCDMLSSEANPIVECEFDPFYLANCELSCCLERIKPSETKASTISSPLVCNGLQNSQENCDEVELTPGDCESASFKKKCALSCCLADGGLLVTTEDTHSAGSTTEVVIPTQGHDSSGIFSTCTSPDLASPEFCSAVVQSQADPDSEDLCQNVYTRNQCLFSCCVYYLASDEALPETPETLDPENCRNLEDVKSYYECFEAYLNNDCDHDCRLTCCLLDSARVPVNPGCYDEDDKAKNSFCVANCLSEKQCEREMCLNKCAFTCCVITSDVTTMSAPSTLPPSSAADSTTTSNDFFTTDALCSSLSDDVSNTVCLDRLKGDVTKCEPSGTMFDTLGCNQQCCILGADLLSTPSTAEPVGSSSTTTNDGA